MIARKKRKAKVGVRVEEEGEELQKEAEEGENLLGRIKVKLVQRNQLHQEEEQEGEVGGRSSATRIVLNC